ncbi:Ccdc87 [Phodopus roborovskii]|uniref:Coiled-coil domain-containing protein 87 n=2 Tax=Phodopus roborovskii TaxID=109678 RepID=A0AAU9ZNB1_PHORO|nr:Ccdc87 [Phodopus roborovskii]
MDPHNQEPDLKPFYHRLLSPLTLFPRKATPPEPPKRPSQEVRTLQSIPLAKLKVGPLCRQVSKRLASSGRAARVTPKDRLCLIQVILEELKCSWQEPPTEPILNYENNQKLRKRLESYVLICSEQLFIRYLHLLVTLPATRKVFTESATLSRLAANLARDCTVFLTSPDVYRFLLADFQTLLNLEQTRGGLSKLRPPACPPGTFELCPIPWPHSTGLDQVPCSSLNLNYLVQLSRPYDFPSEPEPDPVKELKSIPQLKGRKQLLWVPSTKKEKEVEVRPLAMVPSHSPRSSEISPFPTLPIYPRLLRGQSMPCLREGWSLADELGLPPPSPHPLTPLIMAPEKKPLLFGNLVAQDLKQMTKSMAMEWAHYSPLESGLPPLLGVLTRRLTAQHHLENLHQMLKNLQEEEASGQWDLHPPSITPLHPQPVTITLKLQNQIVVQVATVQLSDRCFSDTFHVEGAGVLYNHLTGELDCKAIEEMDADRLVGNSTKEVYKELMSRVSTSHLSFDEGPQIEPSADEDWSTYLSSAFIYQDKHIPVINHDLVGSYSRKTSMSVQQLCPEKIPSLTLLQKRKSWDKRPNRGAWVNWWKTSVSAEDYLKYLTTQETDFLHVIFQMYEEEVPVELPAPVKESLEIQHPPPLLEDEERDFVPGEWNWSSVIEDSSGPGKANILSLQQRLERLWVMLEVPDQSRLDMVVKYSSNARLQQLPALIRAWERVLKPIQKRELLLGRLEWFERQASDPNRFFQKPDLVLSRLLEENRFRSYIQKKLTAMESSLTSLLEKIESVFGEPVTFKGRRYLEKMKQDKVEMLYWLQQQRRVRNLIRAQKASHQSSMFTRGSSQALIAPGNTPTTHLAKCPQTPSSFPNTQTLT